MGRLHVPTSLPTVLMIVVVVVSRASSGTGLDKHVMALCLLPVSLSAAAARESLLTVVLCCDCAITLS